MKKVKIFTDSAADLPAAIVERYDIGVVPLLISHGQSVFADGKDLTHQQFYQLLASSQQLPMTSQPSPQNFIDAFIPYLEQDQQIISINLSSGLSGTVESAMLAQAELGAVAAGRLHIIDSLAASVGQGLLVCLAAALAQKQQPAAEIIAAVHQARPALMHLFTLDTMENLVRGGRISRAKATVGELLNIKPILRLDDEGKIDTLDKVRGRKKSIKYLIDKCLAEADREHFPYLGVSHADSPAAAEAIAQALQQAMPEHTIVIGDIGATIGTHTGPGCIAVFYFK